MTSDNILATFGIAAGAFVCFFGLSRLWRRYAVWINMLGLILLLIALALILLKR